MERKFSWTCISKIVIYVIGTTCFFLYVQDTWGKYTSQATTFASSFKSGDTILYSPQISICYRTSFNLTALNQMNISPDFFSQMAVSDTTWKTFGSRIEMDIAWNRSIFNLFDISKINFNTKVGDSKTSRSFGKDDFKLFDSFAYGRCPTIGDNTIIFKTILDEISIFMPMGHFNESERHVDIWFSNSGSETFGSVGMFVGDTSMHSLEAGYIYVIYAKRRETYFLSTKNYPCDKSIVFQNYSDCLQQYVRSLLIQNQNPTSGVPCYFPYLRFFVAENESPCQSLKALKDTIALIKDTQESFQNPSVTGCSLPCKKEEFFISVRSVPASPYNNLNTDISIRILYQEDKVEVLEEYVLFDFSAIIGSVGGSVGLFLGLSFADLSFIIIQLVQKAVEKRKKNRVEKLSSKGCRCPETR